MHPSESNGPTDKQTFTVMLDRAGVVYRDVPDSERTTHPEPGVTHIEIKAKTGPKNDGYTDFVTYAHFDASDTLIGWSVWE